MTLTSEQIAEIERLIDRLKKWQRGEMPHAIKDFSRYIQLLRFVEPQANIVLMDLSAGMPDTVRVVHVKLQQLLLKASQVDILKQDNTDEARREDSNLMRLARDLVLMLQRVAKDTGQGTLTLNDAENGINDTEQDIIEALGSGTLTGEKLAKEAGHPYNFKFKSSLSGLRKRGILGNKAPGYFLEPEYEFLLKESD
ncbi:MAG: hypothetical protein AMJ65_04945 [Phycisphaerae bacterium SG8_4]|nr:MAG: hypothetical protein AMJ65_04945 [Phycisphaerae bacterium SG8_4]